METTEIRPEVFLKHHDANTCRGDVCPFHNPTDHYLRDFPLDWDAVRGVVMRILPTGEKVLDPDDYKVRNGGILRNSFWCAKCGQESVSLSRHDFVACRCGNFVDGGLDYLRSGGNFDDMVDTSISIVDGKIVGG